MPTGAVVLLSFLLAGLGSLLLRGRRRIGLLLVLNAVILVVGAILAGTWPLFLKDEDLAGWIWAGICLLVDVLGVRFALFDRRGLVFGDAPQAASRWLWMTLFWSAATLACVGICAGAFVVIVGIGFGGPHPLLVTATAAIVVVSGLLVAAVVDVLRAGVASDGFKKASI